MDPQKKEDLEDLSSRLQEAASLLAEFRQYDVTKIDMIQQWCREASVELKQLIVENDTLERGE